MEAQRTAADPDGAGADVVVERADGPHGAATATFDASGVYRYRLTRTWDPDGTTVAYVMLNPSTADADVLDPTVRRCVGFARAWGYGALTVVNLFAYRATDPRVLLSVASPVGPSNDAAVVAAAEGADRVVVAWGVRGTHRGRAAAVSALLDRCGARPVALGTTRSGHPRHPLYVAASTPAVRWNEP